MLIDHFAFGALRLRTLSDPLEANSRDAVRCGCGRSGSGALVGDLAVDESSAVDDNLESKLKGTLERWRAGRVLAQGKSESARAHNVNNNVQHGEHGEAAAGDVRSEHDLRRVLQSGITNAGQ